VQRQLSAFTLTGQALPGVMLANLGFTSYGGLPAILSPELVAIAHRNGWLTVTDDLSVQTLAESTGGDLEEVVRRAFLAGNDILLTTAPFDWDKGMNVHKVLVELLQARPELAPRVDESVLRILRLKERAGLLEPLRAGRESAEAAASGPSDRSVPE
ncbi:MAG: hypothetical protein HY901_38620, partial [Deltaproteobacteria bacterium]|nr:hypothetical protein [Deltaproteobacteria bacterium]